MSATARRGLASSSAASLKFVGGRGACYRYRWILDIFCLCNNVGKYVEMLLPTVTDNHVVFLELRIHCKPPCQG